MTEKELLELLSDFQLLRKRIAELEERIVSKPYKITSTFGGVMGGSSGGMRNKTESYVFARLELKNELERYVKKFRLVTSLLHSDKLTEDERKLLEWIALGGELTRYAEREGIYRSNVYKKRDRLLKKAVKIIQSEI